MRGLVVEDDLALPRTIVRWLLGRGLEVVPATCGEAALEAAGGAALPSVAVVNLRLGGERLAGFAVGETLLKRWPGIGVVYMTCRPDALEGRLLGPREHYIVKPVAPETLLHAVRRLMPAWAPGRTPSWAGLGHAVATAFGLAGAQRGP